MAKNFKDLSEPAAGKVSDVSTRKLLGDLAEAERKHVTLADNLQQEYLTPEVEAQEEKAHRRSRFTDRGYRLRSTHSEEGAINTSSVASQNLANAPWL